MTAPFLEWAAAGFGADLLPLCGPRCSCSSPGKVPHVTGWQTMEITAAMVAGWARSHHGNIGLRTRLYPALDIDVNDLELSAACERVALLTLGSTGRRIRANAARRLLLYKLDGEPFPKSKIEFTTPSGEKAKIELLATGQQCVISGIHHTGAAIEWPAGQPTAAALAPMTAALRDRLVAALRKRLAELGCKVEGGPDAERRTVRWPAPRGDQDVELAELALRRLSPDVPYDDWLRVGMALHSRWPDGSGLALWDSWSARGEKYRGTRDLEQHWRSFDTGGGVGFGTLIVLARGAGR